MDRRRFLLTSLGGVLATPLTVGAQPAGKVWRLAWLGEGVGIAPAEFFLRPFIEGLRDLGYIEGQHFTLVLRFAGANPERLREMAAELVGLKPDLIAAPGTQALLALKMRTSTIPIVMVYPGDPIGTGIVSSLSRPGGNVTGTSLMSSEVSGKRLQILRELVPGLRRVAVIWNPNNASTGSDMRSTEGIAKSMGLQVQPVPVDGTGRMNDALSDVARLRPEGILAIQDAVIFLGRKDIVDFALRNRLATVFPGRVYVDSGGLLAYGPDIPAVGKRAAAYVDKILRGAKPGDLPVEQPTKFDLVINLKTAKALGLTIPPSLLLRADELIE